MVMLRTPQISMVAAVITTSPIITRGPLTTPSLSPKPVTSVSEMKPPKVTTSAWAKLISSMIPYTIV